jgi:hypothetical protein
VDDPPDLDIDRVVATLDRHGVAYLLVGGVAARFHGAVRPTQDIDVLPRSDRENLDRLAAALAELGAFLRIGGMSDEEARALPVVIDGRSLEGMEISTWRTEAGDVDVLQHLRDEHGGRLGYEKLESRGTAIAIVGVEVHLAGLADIVSSKRFAGREKDHDALPELERLLHEGGD